MSLEKNTEDSKDGLCAARIGKGGRCRKNKAEGSDLCKGHIKSLPYGKYNEPLNEKAMQIKKIRGKRISNVAYTMDGLDPSKYFKTVIIELEDNKYLLDEYGILYANTVENNIIGRVSGDKIIWFKQL
jgi:hypothetical protein